ncbi:hypothetical protein BYT27DRAFT_6682628 [Phlegmacium glaucopus]|nr:hypothetical protein BYT27DRAFT_6682628 [Phlegmacium glaucopus]
MPNAYCFVLCALLPHASCLLFRASRCFCLMPHAYGLCLLPLLHTTPFTSCLIQSPYTSCQCPTLMPHALHQSPLPRTHTSYPRLAFLLASSPSLHIYVTAAPKSHSQYHPSARTS